MLSIILTFISNFFSAVITFLVATGTIIDRRRKWLFTKRGFAFLLCVVILISTILIQSYFNQQESKQQQVDIKASYDSTVLKINTANTNNYKDIILALEKNGFKYDSAQKEVKQIIKESIGTKDEKTVISVCPTDVGINLKKINNKEARIEVRFCNLGNQPAYNVNIIGKFLVTKKPYLEYNDFNKSPTNMTIAIGTRYLMSTIMDISNIDFAKDTIYLYFKGTYTNYQKTSIQIFRQLYIYEYDKNNWGMPVAGRDIPILNALKQAKIY